MAETLEEGLAHAWNFVRSFEGADRALVSWDGYLTLGDERTDAVFVEASETACAVSLVFAQRYGTTDPLNQQIVPIGIPLLTARGRSVLA